METVYGDCQSMSQSPANVLPNETIPKASAPQGNRGAAWYQPTFSPEHGVYIVLLVSFLTGAAAAQQWTMATTLALIAAGAGFQAEHPLVLQIKQRRSWKPRFLIWGGLYASVALGIAGYLYSQTPVLLGLYLGAGIALVVDAIAVFHRHQKSVVNEILTFAAVCLSAPLAYAATTGTLTPSAIGLWLLNTLFFSSAIFTVKLRKSRTAAPTAGLLYHTIASLIIVGLGYCGWLAPLTASGFSIVLLKFGLILWQQDWYKTAQIRTVALLETLSALAFLAITALSVLPARLP